jgi:CHAD domain-containing protein
MNRRKHRVTKALLGRRAGALKRHLRAAIEGDGIGVHQARVASRRLREAVPVLAADARHAGAQKARRKIRKLTRALGSVRELDVTLAVLDELAATDTLPRLGLEEVRAHVVDDRERRRAMMLKRLDRVDTAKLDQRLASVGEALGSSDTEHWRQVLSARLLKRAKLLRTAVEGAGQMYSPEALHKVRITTKKLRYGLEIAAETGVRSASALVRQLKRTQDDLGRLHDLQVLQEHVAAVQARPPKRTLPPGSLRALAEALENECRHLHGRYVAAAARLLEVAASTRQVVVPQLTHGRARKTIKMTLGSRARRRSGPSAASSPKPRAM